MRHLGSTREGLWLQDLVKEDLLSTCSAPGSDTQHLGTLLHNVCAALLQMKKDSAEGLSDLPRPCRW